MPIQHVLLVKDLSLVNRTLQLLSEHLLSPQRWHRGNRQGRIVRPVGSSPWRQILLTPQGAAVLSRFLRQQRGFVGCCCREPQLPGLLKELLLSGPVSSFEVRQVRWPSSSLPRPSLPEASEHQQNEKQQQEEEEGKQQDQQQQQQLGVAASASRELPAFTFAELFAGVGGFHVGLAAVGGRCVFASEIDPVPRAIYRRNFLDSPIPPPAVHHVAGGNPATATESMGKDKAERRRRRRERFPFAGDITRVSAKRYSGPRFYIPLSPPPPAPPTSPPSSWVTPPPGNP